MHTSILFLGYLLNLLRKSIVYLPKNLLLTQLRILLAVSLGELFGGLHNIAQAIIFLLMGAYKSYDRMLLEQYAAEILDRCVGDHAYGYLGGVFCVLALFMDLVELL